VSGKHKAIFILASLRTMLVSLPIYLLGFWKSAKFISTFHYPIEAYLKAIEDSLWQDFGMSVRLSSRRSLSRTPQGILMQGIIFYHIRSLDLAVNRREYARYPFKLATEKNLLLLSQFKIS